MPHSAASPPPPESTHPPFFSAGRLALYLLLAALAGSAALPHLTMPWFVEGALAVVVVASFRLLGKPATPEPGERRHRGLELALASVAIVLALVPRMAILEMQSQDLSPDEAINGLAAMDLLEGRPSCPEVAAFLVGTTHGGPIVLQALAIRWLGLAGPALRLPAAAGGALLAGLFYVLARGWCSRPASLLAALTMAYHPTLLQYSFEGVPDIFVLVVYAAALLFLLRIQASGRTADYLCLGVLLGAGLHTNPLAYPVTALVLGVALWLVAAKALAGTGRWLGPSMVCALVAGSATLLLSGFNGGAPACLARVESVSILGLEPSRYGAHLLQAVPAFAKMLAGIEQPPQGWRVLPLLVWELVLVGLLAWWRSGSEPRGVREPEDRAAPRPGPRALLSRGVRFIDSPDAILAVVWLFGLLSPLAVVTDVDHSRRFMLLLVPATILMAIGADALRGFAWLVPVALWGSAGLTIDLGVVQVARYVVSRTTESTERFLRVNRFAREHEAVVARATVSRPCRVFDIDTSMQSVLFMRASRARFVLGLNPFPTFPVTRELDFVLDDCDWLPLLKSVFPGGEVRVWMDREHGNKPVTHYAVSGEEARSHQGLTFRQGEADHPGAPSPQPSTLNPQPSTALPPVQAATRPVPDLQLPEAPAAGCREWSGALYVPENGVSSLKLRGPGRLGFELGRSSRRGDGECVVAGPMAEGWHALRIEQDVTDAAAAPELSWTLGQDAREERVPRWNLLRELPAQNQLRGREAADRTLALAVLETRLAAMAGFEKFEDTVLVGERAYSLRIGDDPLACLDRDARPVAGWKGLSGRLDPPLARGVALFEEYNCSMAASPRGDLLISDKLEGRLVRVSADGGTVDDIRTGVPQAPEGVAFDESESVFLVASPRQGTIARYGVDGTRIGEWRVPGVTAVAAAPGGGPIHAIVPNRDGIVKLSRSGVEIDFWRTPGLSVLSRLACDRDGRVFVLVADTRLVGYDSAGRILIPTQLLPQPIDGTFLHCSGSIQLLPSGRLAIGMRQLQPGWMILGF